MRVAIAGGHGRMAMRLTRLLHERGDAVRSLIPNPEELRDVRRAGAEPVVCDLESVSNGELADAVGEVDAVVFEAGAGLKLIAAGHVAGIERYVMLSSRGTDPERQGDDTFGAYLRAKADFELMASGLDYTIVRPTSMNDEPGTGLVRSNGQVGKSEISRDDVAAVLAAVLRHPETGGLVFEASAGDTPIEAALAAITGRTTWQTTSAT